MKRRKATIDRLMICRLSLTAKPNEAKEDKGGTVHHISWLFRFHAHAIVSSLELRSIEGGTS